MKKEKMWGTMRQRVSYLVNSDAPVIILWSCFGFWVMVSIHFIWICCQFIECDASVHSFWSTFYVCENVMLGAGLEQDSTCSIRIQKLCIWTKAGNIHLFLFTVFFGYWLHLWVTLALIETVLKKSFLT